MPDNPQTPTSVKHASIWSHTIVDVVAVAAVAVLMALDKISMEVGLPVIALIAGVWAKTTGTGGGNTSGLVLPLLLPVADLVRKVKGFAFVLIVAGATQMQACGGDPGVYVPAISKALDVAAQLAEQHGANIEEVPVQCDHEWDPKQRKLLMLCEADL